MLRHLPGEKEKNRLKEGKWRTRGQMPMLDLAFSVDGNEDVFGFVTVFGTPFDVTERDAFTRGVHRVGKLLFFNVVDTNFTIVTCFFIIYLEILINLFENFFGVKIKKNYLLRYIYRPNRILRSRFCSPAHQEHIYGRRRLNICLKSSLFFFYLKKNAINVKK